jgi:DNA-binding transcriptional regulator YbjK
MLYDSTHHEHTSRRHQAAGVPLGSTTYYFDSREHLLREAFRHYLEQARAAQSELALRFQNQGTAGVVDFLVDLTQREFEDESTIRAEYELTLFASRDAAVAEELHDWDEWIVGNLARTLESLGAPQPFDGARTLLDLMRGYELDRLTRHSLDSDGLHRRLETVISAFVPRNQ